MTTSSAFIVPPVAVAVTPIASAVAILTAANANAGQVQDAARKAAAIIVTDNKQFANLKVSTERSKAICNLYAASLTNPWFQKCFNSVCITLMHTDKIEVIVNYTMDDDGKKVYSEKPPMLTPANADKRKALLGAIVENNNKNAGVADATFSERKTITPELAAKTIKMEDIIKIAQAARAINGTGRTTKSAKEETTPDQVTADTMTEKMFGVKLAYHINSANLVLPVIDLLIARADVDEYTMGYLITALMNKGFKCHSDKNLVDARRAREAAAAAQAKPA